MATLQVFTKCLAVVVAFLRKKRVYVFPCLDDWLIKGWSRTQVEPDIHLLQLTFYVLGLLLNFSDPSLKDQVHRGKTRLSASEGSAPKRPIPRNCIPDTIFPKPSNHDRTKVLESPGPHGIVYICNATCKAKTQTPASLASPGLLPLSPSPGFSSHGSSLIL